MKLVKRGKGSAPLAPVSKGLTPFWPMQRLQKEIDRLFEDSFGSWLTPNGPSLEECWVPAVDVYEDKENVFVKAEIPGMKKEEVEVYLTGESLNIAGERKTETEEKSGEIYCAERYFGRFHRSVSLPAAVDATKIHAHYKDGILTVTCPKTDEAKQKHVTIKIE